MSEANPDQSSAAKPPRTEGAGPKAFLKADFTQLAIQVRLLDGQKQTWPYAHLAYHILQGGKLTIFFSEHQVVIHGRHLEGANEGLCLQNLVYLQEIGTRQQEALGEPELPEDQPAIDSIRIYARTWD